jgi:hypothetical protein
MKLYLLYASDYDWCRHYKLYHNKDYAEKVAKRFDRWMAYQDVKSRRNSHQTVGHQDSPGYCCEATPEQCQIRWRENLQYCLDFPTNYCSVQEIEVSTK